MTFVSPRRIAQFPGRWNSYFLQRLFECLHLSRPGFLLLLPIFAIGCAAAPHTNTAHTFRVMTYNIHHGEGLDDKVDLLRIAQLIKEQRTDIVALQEVDKGTERTQKRDF